MGLTFYGFFVNSYLTRNVRIKTKSKENRRVGWQGLEKNTRLSMLRTRCEAREHEGHHH